MRRSPVSRSEATAGGEGSFFRSNRVRARARKEGDCRLRSRRVVRATPFAAANESTTTRIEDPPPKKSNTERAALPKSNHRDDDRRSHLFLFLFLSRSKGA